MHVHIQSHNDPNSKMNVVFLDLVNHVSNGERHTAEKRTRKLGVLGCKKTKTIPFTITRKWQEIWAYRFAWTKGELNVERDVIGIVCWSCITITVLCRENLLQWKKFRFQTATRSTYNMRRCISITPKVP